MIWLESPTGVGFSYSRLNMTANTAGGDTRTGICVSYSLLKFCNRIGYVLIMVCKLFMELYWWDSLWPWCWICSGGCVQFSGGLVGSLPAVPRSRFLHHRRKLRRYLSVRFLAIFMQLCNFSPKHYSLECTISTGECYSLELWQSRSPYNNSVLTIHKQEKVHDWKIFSVVQVAATQSFSPQSVLRLLTSEVFLHLVIGHYVPQLAKKILEQNAISSLKINLKGYMVSTSTLVLNINIKTTIMMCRLSE